MRIHYLASCRRKERITVIQNVLGTYPNKLTWNTYDITFALAKQKYEDDKFVSIF